MQSSLLAVAFVAVLLAQPARCKVEEGGPALQDRIKHVIVLMLENRAFDNAFGYRPGVDGINGTEYNLVNTMDPNSTRVYHTPTCPSINVCDPNHGYPATTFKIYGAEDYVLHNHSDPTMSGFAAYESWDAGNYCNVMTGFLPEKLPVINALADEFVLFDRYFCSFPGPTWPNRLWVLAGTSSGLTETEPWYRETGQLFPTRTILDQIDEAGGTWRVYYNDTPWELWIETIAQHPENSQQVDQLFLDAKNGNLPDFAFIDPRAGINMSMGLAGNDQHPDHDVAVGEDYMRDIYEALRNSPQWNETLLIITYDEHGGFYDHVPPPQGVPPPGDNESSFPDTGVQFDRLGIRVPMLLVSPWVPKGAVQTHPPQDQKPFENSEYEHSSIIATTRKLLRVLNGTAPLTKRDAWAATFEHLLMTRTTPRTDCPASLPPALPFQRTAREEGMLPVNGLQEHILKVHAHLSGVAHPTHITRQADVSQWLQEQYAVHREKASTWRRGKQGASKWTLIVQAELDGGSGSWTVQTNASACGLRNIVTIELPDPDGGLFCLDSGSMTLNATATVSPCYGNTTDPSRNHDRAQHWLLGKDSTLRPYAAQELCLTSRFLQHLPQPILTPCSGSIYQHFAYHGYAPGGGDGGSLYWDDGMSFLAVVQD
jgi:phospholipase C